MNFNYLNAAYCNSIFHFSRNKPDNFINLLFFIFLCLLAGSTLFFSARYTWAESYELKDQSGKSIIIPAQVTRVVSLAPNLTELVFSVGAGEQLVGRCSQSNYPPQADHLPSIGNFFRPDLEKITALKPDLCLALLEATPQELVSRLENMGITVFTLNPHSIATLKESVLLLGRLLKQDSAAKDLSGIIQASLAKVDAMTDKALKNGQKKPVVLIQVQTAPFISAASSTFPGELAERAGGINPIPPGVDYPRVGKEDLLRLKPSVLIAPDNMPLEALKVSRICRVNEDIFFRPSIRSIQDLPALAECILALD